jgi:hypothetical protein
MLRMAQPGARFLFKSPKKIIFNISDKQKQTAGHVIQAAYTNTSRNDN